MCEVDNGVGRAACYPPPAGPPRERLWRVSLQQLHQPGQGLRVGNAPLVVRLDGQEAYGEARLLLDCLLLRVIHAAGPGLAVSTRELRQAEEWHNGLDSPFIHEGLHVLLLLCMLSESVRCSPQSALVHRHALLDLADIAPEKGYEPPNLVYGVGLLRAVTIRELPALALLPVIPRRRPRLALPGHCDELAKSNRLLLPRGQNGLRGLRARAALPLWGGDSPRRRKLRPGAGSVVGTSADSMCSKS
mmetsp:Transcript_65002/g.205351  ORF Transcript_65002/g.205351 Transcript_65002/m.205351 type:complete len:246 (+) Transcript_65002:1015-1752(+)